MQLDLVAKGNNDGSSVDEGVFDIVAQALRQEGYSEDEIRAALLVMIPQFNLSVEAEIMDKLSEEETDALELEAGLRGFDEFKTAMLFLEVYQQKTGASLRDRMITATREVLEGGKSDGNS